uniref:Uncharacterized protein n=1 Tax=Romanomermis culicivorax TaxID=13658 RepID=A0A915KT48_ROMCU
MFCLSTTGNRIKKSFTRLKAIKVSTGRLAHSVYIHKYVPKIPIPTTCFSGSGSSLVNLGRDQDPGRTLSVTCVIPFPIIFCLLICKYIEYGTFYFPFSTVGMLQTGPSHRPNVQEICDRLEEIAAAINVNLNES